MNRQNNTPTNTADKRTCYVGAKVTPMQRETIRTLAARCGMTVSDYLLARSHDYEPKHRLTSRQTDALATLNNCRSDIINYTSALRGCPPLVAVSYSTTTLICSVGSTNCADLPAAYRL